MSREHGYYWILIWDEWQVAKWSNNFGEIKETSAYDDTWFLCGIECFPAFDFHMIEEINETKIVKIG